MITSTGAFLQNLAELIKLSLFEILSLQHYQFKINTPTNRNFMHWKKIKTQLLRSSNNHTMNSNK